MRRSLAAACAMLILVCSSSAPVAVADSVTAPPPVTGRWTASAEYSSPLAETMRGAARLRQTLTSTLRKRSSRIEFAVAAIDHVTGVTYAFHVGAAFETASIVKMDILAALLLRAQDAGRDLTAAQRSLADDMIRSSDNDAATALWWTIGGAAGLARANKRLGLTETRPGRDGWWGLTTTTVADQIRLVDAIADPDGPLDDDSRAYLLALMRGVDPDQDWGVSAGALPGETVALKNGWMPRSNQDGRWTVNSVGWVTGGGTDLAVAVLSRGHTSSAAGIAFVEEIARLVRHAVSP
jgi:hypothetical protein